VAAVTVGLLGGAFDPPHVGHVALARAGIERFALHRLLVRVVADPGHKDVRTDAASRLALARLAFAPLGCAEVELDPFARTVDSLEALALDDPVFLLGADEFADLPRWKEPDRVLELARLGVAARPGVDPQRLEAVLERLARPDRVTFFELAPHPVSSSGIRALVAAGASIAGLVPDAVEAEIVRLGLYAGPGRPGAGGTLRPDPSERTTPT
jgi:nicotinate-nucleotide adenylyltransferase